MLHRRSFALLSSACLGLAMITAAPTLLEAQGTPSRQARAQARRAYAEGQRLFRQGRFEEAEVAFLRAYEHVPNPVVWVSVAEARARQGNVPGAIEAYERYLKDRPDAPDKGAIQKKLEALRDTPARVRITSEPAGAAIALDGEGTGKETPAELEVPAGEHELSLSREGFAPVRRQLVLAPGEQKALQLTLEAQASEAPEGIAEATASEEEPLGDGEPLVEETDLASETSEASEAEEAAPSTAVWVAAGISAAALVGGTVLGFMALSEESNFQEHPSIETADRGERLALFADVSFGVAAVAGVTALVLHFADAPGEEGEEDESLAHVRWTPLLSRNGAGLGARIDF